jgi:hypothetical protein
VGAAYGSMAVGAGIAVAGVFEGLGLEDQGPDGEQIRIGQGVRLR